MSQFSFYSPTPSSPAFVPETNHHDEFYGGIDVGSRFTKVAIINDLQLVSYAILDTGTSVAKAAVGGVAKNKGLRDKLSSHLEISFIPMAVDPQITGALGAAVLAKKIK